MGLEGEKEREVRERGEMVGGWFTFPTPCAVGEVVRADFEAAADLFDVWDLGVIFSVSFGSHGV